MCASQEYLQQIAYLSYPIYFLFPSLIIFFTFSVASVVAYYLKDRVVGRTPTFEQERGVFSRLPNYFCIGDGTGNLLEHLSFAKKLVFYIRESDR